jgi:hypothetical protein
LCREQKAPENEKFTRYVAIFRSWCRAELARYNVLLMIASSEPSTMAANLASLIASESSDNAFPLYQAMEV